MKASLPRKQKGAAAIEFAVVFIVFFAVFYGVVSYSLPLLMMQSFNEASAEAVRRSVAIDPTVTGYATLVRDNAKLVVQEQLQWLPPALAFSASNVDVSLDGTNLLTVKINYPSASLNNVLPFLVLPGIGQVPSLPTYLTAKASLQL